VRVLFLQRQPCIRALKYAAAMRGARGGLTLGFAHQGKTLSGWYGSGDELFDHWYPLGADPAPDLRRAVADFRPDLIHSHNLPDALTVLALGAPAGPPVIHDAHDLQSLRRTPYEDGFDDPEDPLELERRAVEGCAALVVVSAEMLEAIEARHRPATRVLVFPNLALSRDLPEPAPVDRPLDGPPRLVYQGSLSANGSHYDLRDGFRAAAEEGLTVDIYPNRDAPAYRELADRAPEITLHERLSPALLMAELPAYDLGWAIFNPALNGPHLDTALPNKAYEYLGAGLPIVSGPHRALAGLVEGRGLGIVVPEARGLRARLEALDLPAVRRRVAAARPTITVESAIGDLLALYEEVVEDAPAAGRAA
jgi:glycosyltransferase involved in cell wall biosynthesis